MTEQITVNLPDFLTDTTHWIDEELEELIPVNNGMETQLFAAMRYSLFAGGKRLRPAIFRAALSIYDVPELAVRPFAAGLEMIHTYSLIHDDLPAMDDDDYRRGRPSCHKAFSEAMAILTGDALLTHAFYAVHSCNVSADRLIRAAKELSWQMGVGGMVSGQVVDITNSGKTTPSDIDGELLTYLCKNKTGAPFAAAAAGAACLAGAGEEDIQALRDFGDDLGMVFQITDDILDIIGDAQLRGKAIGGDARMNKLTFASVYGIDEARRMVKHYQKRAEDDLRKFGERANLLRLFPAYFAGRDR